MIWGTDLWGFSIGGLDFPIPTASNSFSSFQDFSPVILDGYSMQPQPLHNDQMFPATGPGQSEYLTDGLWKFVFGGGYTNDDLVTNPNYILVTPNSSTWTLSTTSSITWIQP